jgi:hypothetical protein
MNEETSCGLINCPHSEVLAQHGIPYSRVKDNVASQGGDLRRSHWRDAGRYASQYTGKEVGVPASRYGDASPTGTWLNGFSAWVARAVNS